MLQQSFKTIRQHFKPDSKYNKNIFIMKQYDYPQPLVQRLYISYLQLQELLSTKTHDQILKRINITNTKNDKNLQKIVLGFIYAILLHSKKQEKAEDKLQSIQSANIFSQGFDRQRDGLKIISQINQYFNVFRNQAWNLFNSVTLQLLINFFYQIKANHRSGFIEIFKIHQKFSLCGDDLFLALMKTLNFWDQTNLNIRYNLDLLRQFVKTISSAQKNISSQSKFPSKVQETINFSKVKLQQQLSLMRHYLFGKMIHWQFLAQKIRSYRKNDWSFNLQKLCKQSLQFAVILFHSNPEECVVFSSQICRYAEFSIDSPELKQILKAVLTQSSKPINPQFINHHYNLVPIAIQFFVPAQIQKTINQLSQTLYSPSDQDQQALRVQKNNVFLILNWVWKQCTKNFSQETNKSYLLENCLSDIVRLCILSHDKNLELRTFIIEWVFYQSCRNQSIHKTVKQAFFLDWIYYLKTAQQVEFNYVFATFTSSLHIINYFAFYSPQIAENFLVYILGKNIELKSDYQIGKISQGLFRAYINQILKRANNQGILRIREITQQSNLSHYVKSELDLRICEGLNKGIETFKKVQTFTTQNDMITNISNKMVQSNILNKSKSDSFSNSFVQETEYYGDKNLSINFDIKDSTFGHQKMNEDDDQIAYTSHQLIPSSPSYHQLEQNHHTQNENTSGFNLQGKTSYKREHEVSVEELQRQSEGQMRKKRYSQKQAEMTTSLQNNQKNSQQKTTYAKGSKSALKLEKQFVEQLGQQINLLMENPTVLQFTQFIKQLLKVLKSYKKSQQEEMVERFLQQTAKIVYVVFNKEFQSFDFHSGSKEESQNKQGKFLTYFLLKSINQHWKQSLAIYNIFIYKKLVKYLCEAFNSCQFTFYYVLLDIFKKGIPNYKELKLWLFQKEKEKYVIPVLRKILGNKFKIHILENAQTLKII